MRNLLHLGWSARHNGGKGLVREPFLFTRGGDRMRTLRGICLGVTRLPLSNFPMFPAYERQVRI